MNLQKSKPRRPPAEKMRKGIFGATALKQSPAVPRMLPGDFEGHCDGHGLDDVVFSGIKSVDDGDDAFEQCSPITVVILQPNLLVIQLAIGPQVGFLLIHSNFGLAMEIKSTSSLILTITIIIGSKLPLANVTPI